MNTRTRSTLALAAALVLVAACQSPSKVAQPPAAMTQTAAASNTPPPAPTTGAAGQSSVSTVDLNRGAAGAAGAALLTAPKERIVYFDFDSYVIKDEYKNLIDGHARALARNTGQRMVIEGHTDERGGREYNLALGQKRAEAVVRSLALLGVPESQLEAVSFGKERPAATGSNEQAWAQNRRAELKDR